MTMTPPSTPAAQGTVAGWKLVPVEPTDEMLRASCAVNMPALFRTHLRHPDNGASTRAATEAVIADARAQYAAMVAAAPSPEALPASGVEVARKLRLAASSHGHSIPDSIRELMREAAAALTSAPAPEDRT